MSSDQLTKNIWRHELACKCGCGRDTMDYQTLKMVQECCDHFANKLRVDKVVLRITSAHRCAAHNKAVGGAANSQHLYGRAMDFFIEGVKPEDVYYYFNRRNPGRFGLGLYDTFTHFDTRSNGYWRNHDVDQ